MDNLVCRTARLGDYLSEDRFVGNKPNMWGVLKEEQQTQKLLT
jgi:hypothetical protein